MRAPVPQRIAPLRWRKPAILWTPLALAAAIGWPAALLQSAPALQRAVLVAGALVFAMALTSLGAAWALGRAPKARRTVVAHVLAAGAVAAFAAPFVLTRLLAAAAQVRGESGEAAFNAATAMAMTPLALLLGLPIALASGVVFAWAALTPGRAGEGDLVEIDTEAFR